MKYKIKYKIISKEDPKDQKIKTKIIESNNIWSEIEKLNIDDKYFIYDVISWVKLA